MRVVFWDGTAKNVKDRDEAVKTVKEGLKDWMQDGDYLVLAYVTDKPTPEAVKRKPNMATVVSDAGIPTDAIAVIIP